MQGRSGPQECTKAFYRSKNSAGGAERLKEPPVVKDYIRDMLDAMDKAVRFVDGREAFRDIDLGVWFRQGDSRSHFQEGIELSVQLTKKTTIPVDVRPLNEAPVTFVYTVLKGELIDNSDDDLRCRVTERTLREYLDMQPLLERAMREAWT
ncbi:MAG: hypothetical protein WBW79_09430 [Desulfocapsaceae bacterium]